MVSFLDSSPHPHSSMAKDEESLSTTTGKKKRPEDESMIEDVVSKPLQLQRRRVWRACESCRYVHLMTLRIAVRYVNYAFLSVCSIAARRLNVTDVNLRVRSAACQGRNVHGSKPKIGQL